MLGKGAFDTEYHGRPNGSKGCVAEEVEAEALSRNEDTYYLNCTTRTNFLHNTCLLLVLYTR